MGSLAGTRQCSKYVNSCNHYSSPIRSEIWFYKWENWSTEIILMVPGNLESECCHQSRKYTFKHHLTAQTLNPSNTLFQRDFMTYLLCLGGFHLALCLKLSRESCLVTNINNFIIYNVVLVSGVQQSDWVICVCVCKYSYSFSLLFHILFHYNLFQDVEYSSLCYTGGPYCVSLLYISL